MKNTLYEKQTLNNNNLPTFTPEQPGALPQQNIENLTNGSENQKRKVQNRNHGPLDQ